MTTSIDIYETRRTNYEKVLYWKRDIDADIPVSEITGKASNGVFYARETNAESSRNDIVSGAFMFDDRNIMLITNDDVSDLAQNDICKYDDRLWNVISIQRYKRKKRSEFSAKGTYQTYIQLRC